MIDFIFQNPAKIIFGKSALSHLQTEAARFGKRVLLVTGGQSARRIGLYDEVMRILSDGGFTVFELSGIVPNPVLSRVYEGIALCRREKIDLVLALGGGSVIDTGKGIANGVPYDGDVWDFYAGIQVPKAAMPLGVLLTHAAAGSEMSYSSVITNENGRIKRGFNSITNVPTFSILNPEWTYTLPPYQTSCGGVDIMAHMMERYFTDVEHVELTDRMITAGIQTVMHNLPIALQSPDNYDARAEIMWAGALAHNTLLQTGRIGDWCSHKLSHELSAAYNLTHGAALAVLFPAWMKHVLKQNPKKIAQFATDVLAVDPALGTDTQIALEGIKRLEAAYRSYGMPTTLRDAGIVDPDIQALAQKALPEPDSAIGGYVKISRQDAIEIYRLAL
ncbi:MAG TPA: iron-containing alcohol dehydrogenase [Candidatus Limiplasma sp.]|nr:iron-containing alcohol dehydrogenase [Candidatus Limiplasma sp.]